jgi:hypothetical protein
MGADLQRGRPAIVQIATYSLAAVLFLGALAAFFELGHILNQPLIFPGALLLAAAIGILWYSPRWLQRFWAGRRERGRRLAEYPLRVEEVRILKERVKALEQGLGRRFRSGVREGQAQFNGALLAQRVKNMPTIVSVAMPAGRLQLTCHRTGPEPIALNTRFFLLVTGSEQPLGALTITNLADDGETLTGETVEETDQAFWAHLRQRADHDFAPPQGVSLAPYRVSALVEEQQAADHGIEILMEGANED